MIFKVGGHTKFVKLSNGFIGKPLIAREAEMYKVRPEPISRFMPGFKGKIICENTFFSCIKGFSI